MSSTGVLDMAARTSPRVAGVELVRASEAMSLLRVELDAAIAVQDVLLVVRGVGLPRRLRPLPTADSADGGTRLGFAVATELRDGRFALQLPDSELPLPVPPERAREDAVVRVELERTRRRVAELESALGAAPAFGDAPTTEADSRLAQQLNEHRLMRAQLARELEAARRRSAQAEAELESARAMRAELEHQLAAEQADRAAETQRLTEAVEAAHARVRYLENRLVELRNRGQIAD